VKIFYLTTHIHSSSKGFFAKTESRAIATIPVSLNGGPFLVQCTAVQFRFLL